jgi:hypothetical protein
MHVEVRRPDRIRFGVRREERASRSIRSVWLELAARGLATGFGVGLLAMAGSRAAVADVAVIGVIAIGAALLSWER